jgi:hypothetical protein
MFCPNCATKNAEFVTVCEQCGSEIKKYNPPVQRHHTHPAQLAWMLKVKKFHSINIAVSQKYGGSADFDIIANGLSQGKVKAGKSIVVISGEPEVEIVVKGWGLNPMKTKLKLGENAYAELGMWKKNIILYTVTGAEVV